MFIAISVQGGGEDLVGSPWTNDAYFVRLYFTIPSEARVRSHLCNVLD